MKIERKIYAMVLVSILLAAGILSALATRTFTDSNDTWTGTIVQSGNLDFKSGSYFNLSKKICNSKGHVYNATLANINQAIWDLNSTKGGTVWLPGTTITGAGTGIGLYSYGILMCSGVTLKGAGMNSTTLKLTTGSLVQAVISCMNINNFTLSDFSINGFNDTTSDNYQAIWAIGCKYFLYQNIHVQNMFRSCIQFGASSIATESKYGKLSNIWVDYGQDIFPAVYQPLCGRNVNHTVFENIHIHGDGTKNTKGAWGMDWVQTSWNEFNNIYIDGMGYGAKFFSTGNHNITVNNMQIRGCTNASDAMVWLYAIKDSSFDNIHIQTQYQGIQLSSAGPHINLNNIVIYCTGNAPAIWASGDWINFNNIQLYGNDLSYGMYLYGCDDSKYNNIEVNNFNSGIYLENCDRFMMGQMKITNSVGLGIYGKTNTYFTIHDSEFINNGGDGIDLIDATACHNFTINSNIFSSNTGKSIDLSATSNYFTIYSNICTNADEIDLNAANSTTRLCHDNIARIT